MARNGFVERWEKTALLYETAVMKRVSILPAPFRAMIDG
jgi:hypothetical protein